MARGKKSRKIIHDAFAEVRGNTPSRVKQTLRTRGRKAAEKQRTAIALSKAKKRGARI